jgi:exonuclease III
MLSTINPTHETTNTKKKHLSPRLRIATWNASGISGKVDELLQVMNDNNIDFTFVTETWLQEHENCHPQVLHNLSAPRLPNQPYSFYGLAVVASPYTRHYTNSNHSIRLQALDETHERPYGPLYAIFSLHEGTRIALLYLPPSLDIDNCQKVMNDALAHNPHIVLGDLNMPLGTLINDGATTKKRTNTPWLAIYKKILVSQLFG